MLNSLIEKLKQVKDFRKNKGKRHELWVVLTIIILAILMGHTSYRGIDEFRKTQEKKLIKLLKVPRCHLASYSTIRRVMIGIELKEIHSIFKSIINEFYQNKKHKDWIAIDGKVLKNTLTNYENKQQNMLMMVSWFSQETKLVIKAESFETKKSCETYQVETMVENCDVINKVFTLDALHCNKKLTQAIIESKNDYLITVKGNQIKLYNKLKIYANLEKPLTVFNSKEYSHGRYVRRKISVFNGKKVKNKNYPHLQSFIEVKRIGFRGKKEYNETLYYISSKKLSADIFAEKIRGHWSIENQVHWVKDVIFKEDKSRIKDTNVAEKFSLFVTLILNVYRSLGFISIKKGQYYLGNNWEKILALA